MLLLRVNISLLLIPILALLGINNPHQGNPDIVKSIQDIPPVFLIGEYEELYEDLKKHYSKSLLEVCDEDMNVAYKNWMHMMTSMETYADDIGFDIRGMKVWLNIYWQADGSVDHFAFFLRPDSRNFKTEALEAFFNSFIRQYQMPTNTENHFWHNGVASFPTFYSALTTETH